mmetsp:Transcript_10252/g.17148  ORF Transcript_10252/g.17148 Transcript_10252/m.17148 type:complete len:805 (-) Transcript_10252:212-2626(-)|eukprot:CAMPEP_0174996768 /NCGR_PEP_ID=MMETSP0005-20121125/582_1 /TAXON_ID=420556 /ORGANISM="Ochromonas sp., Strain CCMP1393" /LENGTH=804 /DNA_ID=CAMNT_0016251221 /DNA_START=85 /DNA_END=2499 /DNA_ORIENTATION=-
MLQLLVLCLAVLKTVLGGWIDPDTLASEKSLTSYVDGRKYNLVFSDEFNTEGRYFHDGSDPRWTSIHKDDYTNYALHYYNSDLVKTSNGYLNISTILEDISFSYVDAKTSSKPGKKTKNYQSGMLQGWNKFCFTGGIVEVSAKLPGNAFIGGLWPAIWMLGNLARATYVGSSNNIWPWSFDICKRGQSQHQQLFSACNKLNHYDLHSEQGRGAPEIDILEAMPGKADLKKTSTKKPYFSASLQVAPGIENYRPTVGLPPNKGMWYDQEELEYGRNTSQNIFFYGMHLEGSTKDKSYTADAVSANRNIEPSYFEEQHVYRVEWRPGPDGYIQWHLDGELVYRINRAALNITGALIPEEPMYLLFNTAISATWGFPMPCPDGCACDCYDCRDRTCACAIPPGMCSNFPADMLIDYVRVYQDESDDSQVVGCSTHTHPTRTFIEGHPSMYKSASDSEPLHRVEHGGGHCVVEDDCGGPLPAYYSSSSSSTDGDDNAVAAAGSTGYFHVGGPGSGRETDHSGSGRDHARLSRISSSSSLNSSGRKKMPFEDGSSSSASGSSSGGGDNVSENASVQEYPARLPVGDAAVAAGRIEVASYFSFGDGYIAPGDGVTHQGDFQNMLLDASSSSTSGEYGTYSDGGSGGAGGGKKGTCVRKKCVCLTEAYTGPNCLAHHGFDDIIWDPPQPLIASHMFVPVSLMLLVAITAVLLLVLAGWKFAYEKSIRVYDRIRNPDSRQTDHSTTSSSNDSGSSNYRHMGASSADERRSLLGSTTGRGRGGGGGGEDDVEMSFPAGAVPAIGNRGPVVNKR